MNYSVIIKKKCFPNMCVDYCKQIFIKDKSIHNHREETKSVVVKKTSSKNFVKSKTNLFSTQFDNLFFYFILLMS